MIAGFFLTFAFLTFLSADDAARKIAFERDNAIWIASLDGKSEKQIAEGNLPEISPDGTRVAFNTDEPSDKTPIRHIAVAEIATGKTTVLKDTPSDNSFGPVWSPDSKSLLFSIYMEGDWQLGFINADGTGFRVVRKTENKSQPCGAPAWAPDGKSYFCHDLEAIYRFDMAGVMQKKWEIHAIIDHGDMNSNSRIAVSPDSSLLIMEIDMDEDHNRENWDGPPPAIWALNLSAKKATRLTAKDLFAWEPFWISNEEFLFMSQGPKEDVASLYRGSIKGADHKLIIRNGRTPSVNH